MAKRRSGTKTTRAQASDRPQAAGGRRRAKGRAASGVRGQSKRKLATGSVAELLTGTTGRRRRAGGGGVLGTAKEIAQSVGQTTVGAAQSGLGAARGAASAVASGARQTASQVAGKVRENPWPSLLIGAGATWLVVDAVRGRSNGARRGRPSSERGAVGEAVSKVAHAGAAAGEQIGEFVRERPLLAGATALGLGVAAGMAVPSGLTEGEMLGGVPKKIGRRAREATKVAVDKVRDIAEAFDPFSSSPSGRASSRRR